MKGFLKTFVFVLISLNVTGYVLSSLYYSPDIKTFYVVALAITVLFYVSKPILTVFGLPSRGLGFAFISTVLATITLYVLTLFLSGFMILNTTLSDLIIFGVMLPSKSLNVFWSAVFSAFVLSVVYTFFEWLCSSKK
jgi:uncharacterized membrane protein YvlD (DUF360 family)